MTNLETSFSITQQGELFKTDFKEVAEDVTNKDVMIWSQISKPPMTAKLTEFPVPFGYAGGASSGSIGEAYPKDNKSVQFSHKKVYQKILFDRDAVAASMDSKGAFVKALQEDFDDGFEAFTWNMNRIAWNDGSGKLGTIASTSGVTDNGGGNYSIVISDATWKLANWEEGNFVNIETLNTELFLIESVAPSTKTIVVQRQSGGSQVPANSDAVFLQKSETNDPQGIKGVLDATSSTKYNVAIGRKWQAYQQAVSAAIDFDIINDTLVAIESKVGKKRKINLIATSYTQYGKLLNLSEDQKRYPVSNTSVKARDSRLKELIGFSGVEVMFSNGPIAVVPERFVEDDRMYFLNTDFIKGYTMPKSGWVADDGREYLRVENEDKFSAYYAWYGELYIAPTYQGVLTALSL